MATALLERVAPVAAPAPQAPPPWYLFSPRVDLVAFLGSAVLSLIALGIGWKLGLFERDTPQWAWIVGVLLVDVAHVYATVFRVYADPDELRRAPIRYALTPLIALAIGMVLYAACGELAFWRMLAYVAVFHFIRQQYGWVMLYRARRGEHDAWGRRLDAAAIYAATLYPLLYWHAHLPRRFWWFMAQDFPAVPFDLGPLLTGARALWMGLLIAYAWRAWTAPVSNPGKHIVVATTALCWWVGIVALDSDYAFTMTNVLIHGIPYLVLVYWYGHDRSAQPGPGLYRLFARGPVPFLIVLWAAAFVEEMVWDRAVWHSRAELFGSPWDVGQMALIVLVPLLALPQLVHYLLDGWLWKRRSGPFMERLLHHS